MGPANVAVICRELGNQLRSHFVLPVRMDFLLRRSNGGIQIWLTMDFPPENWDMVGPPPWPPVTKGWTDFFIAFDDLELADDGSVAFSESWLARFEEFYGFPTVVA